MQADGQSDAVAELVTANRILAREGVLDSFGHVSRRHPAHPDRYLIARAVSPAGVDAEDIVEVTLAGEAVVRPDVRLYGERVIHGAIYAARPDVMSVCHHHAAGVMPFANTGVPIIPVFHVGAVVGATVPVWDSRDEFGDTNLLVATAQEGASLAQALGPHWCVVMRRHGATVAGRSLRETVFRSIALDRNADIQLKTMTLGGPSALTPAEIDRAAALNLSPHVLERAWGNWSRGL